MIIVLVAQIHSVRCERGIIGILRAVPHHRGCIGHRLLHRHLRPHPLLRHRLHRPAIGGIEEIEIGQHFKANYM